MGQRANLLLVRNGRYELFYSHWAANTLSRDLFWGPAHATAFVEIQRRVDESGWLDDIWGEGGGVVDHDARTLLLFGGEEILFDVPLRRVYLELLAQVWQGWQVCWAREGVADLADYVRYPRERVLSRTDDWDSNCVLQPPLEKGWTDIVASIQDESGLRLFPLAGNVRSYLTGGSNLVAAAGAGLPTFEFDGEGFPTGGFHLDLLRREVEFWIATPEPGLDVRLTDLWPGWRIVNHLDHYEFQLERTGPALCLPTRSRQSLVEQVRDILMREKSSSMVTTVLSLAEKDTADGKSVKVNPMALRDDRLELGREQKEAILRAALGELAT